MNVFIGEMPPPFGGVAVKDKILYQEVYRSAGVKMLNLVECKWKPWKIPLVGLELLWLLLIADNVIVGVGSNQRRKVIMCLRYVLRGNRGLSSIRMIMMGGVVQDIVKKDSFLKKLLINTGTIWVETEGMKKGLESQGFRNIRIFPNCRTEEGSLPPVKCENKIRYVFFSRICKQKGVTAIFRSVDRWTGNWSLDFYGEIEKEYEEEFHALMKEYPQAVYHGVFDATTKDLYRELNQYDVLLFPSEYTTEGVPGVLVEAKMAGITMAVSDSSFNSEIVNDGVDGVVIRSDLAEELNSLSFEMINIMKINSFDSRKKYSISSYRDPLLDELK